MDPSSSAPTSTRTASNDDDPKGWLLEEAVAWARDADHVKNIESLNKFATANNPKAHLAMHVAACLAPNRSVMSIAQKVAGLQASRDSASEAGSSESDLALRVARCIVREVTEQIPEEDNRNTPSGIGIAVVNDA